MAIYISNQKVIEAELREGNSILHLRAKSFGVSLCSVYLLDNPQVYDIFIVRVGSIITPTSPVLVHEGGLIQFNVNNNLRNVGNKWFSDDPSIITIHPVTGRAVAQKRGQTSITFSDTIQYSTKVNVFLIDRVETSRIKMTNLPNHPDYNEEYELPLTFYSGDKEISNLFTDNEAINNNLKLRCDTIHSEWIMVQQKMTLEGNKPKYTCTVRPKKATYSTESVYYDGFITSNN